MLPFLKPKTVAGLIIQKRKSDGGQETVSPDGSSDAGAGLEACMTDLISAVEAKDAKAAASAFKAAMDCCDNQPEAPETSEGD